MLSRATTGCRICGFQAADQSGAGSPYPAIKKGLQVPVGLALSAFLNGPSPPGSCRGWRLGRRHSATPPAIGTSNRSNSGPGVASVTGLCMVLCQSLAHCLQCFNPRAPLAAVLMPIDALVTGPAGNLLVAVEGVGEARLFVAVQGADAF